jgi:type IV pilus assembly protein PilC
MGTGISARERAAFTRQLAVLLRAGMPLVRAVDVLARQEANPRLADVLRQLGQGIRSGTTLSDALAQHPRLFDRLYLNMVRAGEAGGALEVVLDRLARFQEKSLQIRGKVAAALVYPLIVLVVALTILIGLLTIVVPKFQQIFAELLRGAPLPPLTQGVLAVSAAVKTHLPLTGLLLGLVVLLFPVLQRRPLIERWLDQLKLLAPMFGPLVRKAIVARFGRTLGTLLSSGVPILPALLITRDTCGNSRVASAIAQVHDRVKAGASLAQPLGATAVFPPMVASMIEVGEQTGQLPAMLGKVAEIYEEEVDTAVAGLSALIEPLLILFLALVVGTIVIALFLPIVRIVQLLT